VANAARGEFGLSIVNGQPVGGAMPRILLEGDIPSAIALPKGCSFAGRCPLAMQVCRSETPRLRRFGSRQVACHLHEEGSESRGHSVASLMQKSIRLR